MKIAVFASGSGSNARNIIQYFNIDHLADGEVSLVVTNRPGAGVIGKATSMGVPVEIKSKQEINDPDEILGLLDRYGVTHIVLAGFLLMVPEFIVTRFPHRIINIHPSLLPRHGGAGMYGKHVHHAVKESGDSETGITIHYVSEEYDRGRIIFQTRVEVVPDDTPESIEIKIHQLEKEHFPRVIAETFGCQSRL